MTSYFRTQTADRDVTELLDPEYQFSTKWFTNGEVDQPGVSVCGSLEDLATYLAQSGIPIGDGNEWVIVELRGERIWDARPTDAEIGEMLVRPTEILSVRPMGQAFFDMINAACDEMGF